MLDANREEGQEQRSELIEVMALWENKTKDGDTYLSGNFGKVRVLVFRNKFKQGEREPDYRLYVTKRAMDDRATGGSQPASEGAPAGQKKQEDDIPF